MLCEVRKTGEVRPGTGNVYARDNPFIHEILLTTNNTGAVAVHGDGDAALSGIMPGKLRIEHTPHEEDRAGGDIADDKEEGVVDGQDDILHRHG